ncbi:MAG: TauD/TfdA family dioxygenase [Pseudomonadota bacterium]
MPGSDLSIVPLTPSLGAEISGIDLSGDLDEATVQAIQDALMDYLVVFFRDQALDLDQLSAFGRRFGLPHTHPAEPDVPGYPGVLKIHTDASSKTYSGRKWHSDVTCDAEPPMGSILHLHQVPASGGDTLFANMYAAYEALSAPLRQMLDGLTAVHGSEHNFRGYYGTPDEDLRDGMFPESRHPVVRRHPVTGREALFVNEIFTLRIEELSTAESEALLNLLYEHINEPRFHCRFRWQANSVAFWDNRSAQHLALWDYYPETRSGHRFTIQGDRPV